MSTSTSRCCLPGHLERPGQRVEFGIAQGRKGAKALQVRLIEPPPTVAVKSARKKPDEMVVLVEDLIKLLDGVSNTYLRGKHPDGRDAKKIGAVLRAVADDVRPTPSTRPAAPWAPARASLSRAAAPRPRGPAGGGAATALAARWRRPARRR